MPRCTRRFVLMNGRPVATPADRCSMLVELTSNTPEGVAQRVVDDATAGYGLGRCALF